MLQLYEMPKEFLAVDVEGNGVRPPDLVELAVVSIKGLRVVGHPRVWLFKPDLPIERFATRIHGITNSDVSDAPNFAAYEPEIRNFFGSLPIVAHHAGVDYAVLKRKMPGWEPTIVLDTLRLARKIKPGLPTYRLGALVAQFGLDELLANSECPPHRAKYDALAAAHLFIALMDHGRRSGHESSELCLLARLTPKMEEKEPRIAQNF